MALSVPSYNNPFDPANPFANVYAYTAGVYFDASTNTGRMVLNVHPSEETWVNPPIDQVSIVLGEVLVAADPSADPPVEEVTFPTLDQLMTNPDFATAYNTIGGILYQHAMQHAKFAGSTIV